MTIARLIFGNPFETSSLGASCLSSKIPGGAAEVRRR